MNGAVEFRLVVLYSQIQVCRAGHPEPGSLWTGEHVAQGFAWRPEAVSFGVPDHDGECLLRAEVLDQPREPASEALWAIRVPFASTTGTVEVGGIAGTQTLDVPFGDHALVFEALPGKDGLAYDLRLTFQPGKAVTFVILRRGGELAADIPLRLDAEAA